MNHTDKAKGFLHKQSLVVIVSGIFLSLMAACTSPQQQAANEEEYIQAVSDFYVSLGASQTDEARFAFNKMNDVAQAFPEEAAAWANLGVYAMRQGNFGLASERISQAVELQPEHSDILLLAGIIESRQGNIDEAVRFFRRATDAGPENLRALFSLAGELERQDDAANQEEITRLLEQLVEKQPENQLLLIELARAQLKSGKFQHALQTINRLEESEGELSEEIEYYFDSILEFIEQTDGTSAILELSFLQTLLEPDSRFQADALQVRLPPSDVGFLITEFLYLEPPSIKTAEPDLDMALAETPLELPASSVAWLKGVTLLEDLPPFPISVSNGNIIIDESVQLDFPGDTGSLLPVHSVTEIDYNYNFRNDLAAAGSEGFRLYELNDDQTFTDVTPRLGLSQAVTNGNYHGVSAFDIEMDGDLDLLLTSPGQPVLLRNNGDGTFAELPVFPEAADAQQFLWADLNDDGAPEAVFLTVAGEVFVYENLRGGNFSKAINLAENIAAISVGDLNADSRFELITVNRQGQVQLQFFDERTGLPATQHLFSLNQQPANNPFHQYMFIADIDNNGGLDILYSEPGSAELWLGSGNLQFTKHPISETGGFITHLFDVEGNERLDMLMIGENQQPVYLENTSTKDYFARSIRARASGDTGDHRINSFGIGGEMEIRSGLLYQKQLISSPIVHVGLGEYTEADMLRIIWPNGSVQAEFAELGMGETIFNEQILKGSCPWLFANTGKSIEFVTDALWRSPLGLRINAQETAGVVQTFDRVRISPDQINIVDGRYDLRITAELWETHFFDYVGLIAVDHPEDTEIFVDERFVFPVPDLSTRIMYAPHPVQKVTGGHGQDLTQTVSEMNGTYISPFTKTPYQGLVEEHSIVISLENSDTNAEWLLLSGWLRPTDSSINLALSQGSISPPGGLKVEVRNEHSKWVVLHENYGFPAGKLKTILLDLEPAFDNGSGREIRLTTTSEIYWDGIFQAQKADAGLMAEFPLEPVKQELRYRGYSLWSRADSTSPKLPDYSEISSTAQRWRDLEGFHTRFGDVTELLQEIDDRYVIMNAGDEMVLHFDAGDSPQKGYKRSFIFVSDGWVKDGDYNTEASATVLPLPYHGMADYEYTRGEKLSEDPVYQKHRGDWVNYHTRYVQPYSFRTALLPEAVSQQNRAVQTSNPGEHE